MITGSNAAVDRDVEVFEVDEIFTGSQGFAEGPERALLSAILFDAVQLILTKSSEDYSAQRAPVSEAICWLLSTESDYVFSFQNVCEGLGIDPEYLRLGVINSLNTRKQRRLRRRN